MKREEEMMHKAGSIVDGMVSNNVPSEICDSYYQGFIDGAKWADKTMIIKACDWLKEKNKMCMYELEMILGGNFINDFKKAMEL